MQDDLVKELEAFGFTLNQAKVYLTIVGAGSCSVSKIAKSSKLYRQDIYKIIPNLEKKGVITRTLGKPILLKAIPVKKALTHLVSKERENALERIKRMEALLERVSNTVIDMHETEARPQKAETHFSLLTEENEIINRADLLYEEAKKECNIVSSIELMAIRRTNFYERFRRATNNGAKIRLLIEARRIEEQIESTVERVRPDSGNFAAKLFICRSPKPFQIIDRKEVWVSATLKTESRTPCVLWSNEENIVSAYQERFETKWNSKKATTIHSSETAKENAIKAMSAT